MFHWSFSVQIHLFVLFPIIGSLTLYNKLPNIKPFKIRLLYWAF